jgi:hypothetical protein
MNMQNALVADERMVFQDKQRKYYEDVQNKQQLIAGGFAGLGGMFGTVAQGGSLMYQMQNQLGPFNPNPYGYRNTTGGQTPPQEGEVKTVNGVNYMYDQGQWVEI